MIVTCKSARAGEVAASGMPTATPALAAITTHIAASVTGWWSATNRPWASPVGKACTHTATAPTATPRRTKVRP